MSTYKIKNFGRFLKNPEKYQGDKTKIDLRSGWEIKFATWLDKHPSVVAWNSEEIVIPYYMTYSRNGVQYQKKHRYFMDFWMRVEQEDGTFKEYLIEVKPQKQKDDAFLLREGKTIPTPQRNTAKGLRRYYKRVAVANKNNEKWKATEDVCKALRAKGRDIQFVIMTEKDLPV